MYIPSFISVLPLAVLLKNLKTISFSNKANEKYSQLDNVESIKQSPIILNYKNTIANSKESSKFIHIPSSNTDLQYKASAIIIPGFSVKPKNYETLAYYIQNYLDRNDISIDIYITKFTGNIMHNIESDYVVNNILKKVGFNNTFIIGHSQGAYNGIHISNKYDLPLIQLGATFNSKFVFPFPSESIGNFEQPLFQLINEQDEYLSSLDAIKDAEDIIKYPSSRNFAISLPFMSHFSGILPNNQDKKFNSNYFNGTLGTPTQNHNLYANTIAKKIGLFINFIITNSQEVKNTLFDEQAITYSKFSTFLYESSTPSHSIYDWGMLRQSDIIENTFTINCVNHNIANSMVVGILCAAFTQLKFLIDVYMLFPNFIKSHPQINNNNLYIHVYSPVKNPIFTNTYKITEPENWVKFKISPNIPFSVKQLNQNTFNEVFETLETKDKDFYLSIGKKMIFEDDIIIPTIPGCSLIWISTPISIKYNKNNVVIRSPMLKTPIGEGKYDSRLNAKLISSAQVLEWVLVKAFM